MQDRYFSHDPAWKRAALALYESVADLPLVCPHGHVDPRLFADPDYQFGSPVDLLIIPDHYIFRMLYSQGVALDELGIQPIQSPPGKPWGDFTGVSTHHRVIWQRVCDHWHLFRAPRPPASGCALNWRMCSTSSSSSTAPMLWQSTMLLLRSWAAPNSVRARFSSASISRCWRPRTRQLIRLSSIRRYALPAGAGASSRLSAPMRSSTSIRPAGATISIGSATSPA